MTVRVIGLTDLQFDEPRLRRLMEHINRLTKDFQAIQQMLDEGREGQVLVKRSSRDFDAGWADGGGGGAGEANNGANLGNGVGIFAGKSGVTLQFRSLRPGSGVTIDAQGDEIVIRATGSAEDLEPFIYAGAF